VWWRVRGRACGGDAAGADRARARCFLAGLGDVDDITTRLDDSGAACTGARSRVTNRYVVGEPYQRLLRGR
jgi:hypothetical protein